MSKQMKALSGCDVLRPADDARDKDTKAISPLAPNAKRGDRFNILNSFVDFSLVGLKRNELAVWLVLYRVTRDGIARTGQSDIARRIGATRRTVTRAISKLEFLKLIQVVRRGGLNQGVSTYRVLPLRTPDE